MPLPIIFGFLAGGVAVAALSEMAHKRATPTSDVGAVTSNSPPPNNDPGNTGIVITSTGDTAFTKKTDSGTQIVEPVDVGHAGPGTPPTASVPAEKSIATPVAVTQPKSDIARIQVATFNRQLYTNREIGDQILDQTAKGAVPRGIVY